MPELPYRIEDRDVSIVVDETLYPLDAIYGTAYVFIDRCFVFLTRPRDRKVDVEVRLRLREGCEQDPHRLVGEFANELLNQALRASLAASTATLRDYYMARAFFSTPAPASIDALLAELDAEELAKGEVEIKLPWQERQ